MAASLTVDHRSERDNGLLRDDALLFPPGTRERGRLLGLDVLRAVALLLVLYAHINFRMDPQQTFAYRFFFIVRQMGLIGVDIFLVLSGFLIGGEFFAEHKQ